MGRVVHDEIHADDVDHDDPERRVLGAGGRVALPEQPLPGMAWQGYDLDPEGSTSGLHEPDPAAT